MLCNKCGVLKCIVECATVTYMGTQYTLVHSYPIPTKPSAKVN